MRCYHRQEGEVDFRDPPGHSLDKSIWMGKLLRSEGHWLAGAGDWTYQEVIVCVMLFPLTIVTTYSLTSNCQ